MQRLQLNYFAWNQGNERNKWNVIDITVLYVHFGIITTITNVGFRAFLNQFWTWHYTNFPYRFQFLYPVWVNWINALRPSTAHPSLPNHFQWISQILGLCVICAGWNISNASWNMRICASILYDVIGVGRKKNKLPTLWTIENCFLKSAMRHRSSVLGQHNEYHLQPWHKLVVSCEG